MTPTAMSLDQTDRTLLQALQQDASRRLEDLARLVGLAPSSVHDRLARLTRQGVLRRWTVDVDPGAIGLGVLAYVGVRSSRACSAMTGALEAIPAIEECHSVAGELSLLLKVRVADPPALLALIERLREIPGVEQTETTIVLGTQFDRPIPPPPEPLPPRPRGRPGAR